MNRIIRVNWIISVLFLANAIVLPFAADYQGKGMTGSDYVFVLMFPSMLFFMWLYLLFIIDSLKKEDGGWISLFLVWIPLVNKTYIYRYMRWCAYIFWCLFIGLSGVLTFANIYNAKLILANTMRLLGT
jgi:hypothetical protein